MSTDGYGSCFRYSDHCDACRYWATYAAELTEAATASKPRQTLRSATGTVVHLAAAENALQSLCAPLGRMGARPMDLYRTGREATCRTCFKRAEAGH